MKVFVATNEGQGARNNDFCWTTEGELVGFAFECDNERIDGKCGCKRSLAGFDSHKSTTTFKVIDMQITEKEYVEKFLYSLMQAGWYVPTDKEGTETYTETAQELLNLAELFQIGTILEKRGYRIQTRNVKCVQIHQEGEIKKQ